MSRSHRIQPKYVDGDTHPLFVFEALPAGQDRGSVLICPPFAEEMNRSRKMLSRIARRLADRGYRAILPDLGGTGDSYGSFADATAESWARDLAAVAAQSGMTDDSSNTVLALRSGALIALASMTGNALPAQRLILWSPGTTGAALMTQFLRLRLMSAMIGKSGDKETMADLKARLASGKSLEIAGYKLSPALYQTMDALSLEALLNAVRVPVTWFELVADSSSPFPLASAQIAGRLADAGCPVQPVAVAGPKFWSTVEITMAPALETATVECLDAA